jgi:hypothetical protein
MMTIHNRNSPTAITSKLQTLTLYRPTSLPSAVAKNTQFNTITETTEDLKRKSIIDEETTGSATYIQCELMA